MAPIGLGGGALQLLQDRALDGPGDVDGEPGVELADRWLCLLVSVGAVMRVAILGTGKMGGAMARRLKALGHELTLWNRTRSRAEALSVGKVAATPAEAAV